MIFLFLLREPDQVQKIKKNLEIICSKYLFAANTCVYRKM